MKIASFHAAAFVCGLAAFSAGPVFAQTTASTATASGSRTEMGWLGFDPGWLGLIGLLGLGGLVRQRDSSDIGRKTEVRGRPLV